MVEKALQDGQMKDGRLYYSIGEVSEMVGVKPHTLHYWESAFPVLKPHKNQAGNRCYRPGDIEMVKLINRLVNQEGYSIEGARKQIEAMRKSNGQLALEFSSSAASDLELDALCSELAGIIRDISREPLSELDES
jgi:DNA-binding transcriptional MerR regulator